MNLDDLPVTLTVEETAKLLGISRGLAFKAANSREIPTIRIGRRLLVPVDQLRRMLTGVETVEDRLVLARTRQG